MLQSFDYAIDEFQPGISSGGDFGFQNYPDSSALPVVEPFAAPSPIQPAAVEPSPQLAPEIVSPPVEALPTIDYAPALPIYYAPAVEAQTQAPPQNYFVPPVAIETPQIQPQIQPEIQPPTKIVITSPNNFDSSFSNFPVEAKAFLPMVSAPIDAAPPEIVSPMVSAPIVVSAPPEIQPAAVEPSPEAFTPTRIFIKSADFALPVSEQQPDIISPTPQLQPVEQTPQLQPIEQTPLQILPEIISPPVQMQPVENLPVAPPVPSAPAPIMKQAEFQDFSQSFYGDSSNEVPGFVSPEFGGGGISGGGGGISPYSFYPDLPIVSPVSPMQNTETPFPQSILNKPLTMATPDNPMLTLVPTPAAAVQPAASPQPIVPTVLDPAVTKIVITSSDSSLAPAATAAITAVTPAATNLLFGYPAEYVYIGGAVAGGVLLMLLMR